MSSKRESDEVKAKVERVVEKFLGFTEPVLSATAINCLVNGYDKKKTSEKLSSLLEGSKAERLAEKLMGVIEAPRHQRKRHHDQDQAADTKKSKTADGDQLSPNQIKEMMANAQKMIEERKRSLVAMKGGSGGNAKEAPPTTKNAAVRRGPDTEDKARKILALQDQIKRKLSSGLVAPLGGAGGGGGGGGIGGTGPLDSLMLPPRPTPLILDAEGRTVDSTGKQVHLTHVLPTLKANIRAKKREEFKAQLQEKPAEELSEGQFFDPRISNRPGVRNKKSLRFNQPGKFTQMADRMRMKAQLYKLQGEISEIARKTGITSATKLAQIAPKVEGATKDIPDVEWWDSIILLKREYPADEEIGLNQEAVTRLIEHPTQMRAPAESGSKSVCLPVYLTQKERRKLRRQNRREAWKEEQEKIRLGLEPPPQPKVRISNLMRVLGSEAVQDPTKVEVKVKADMARRLKTHHDTNQARKLTQEQRREKRRRALQEDTTLGVHVSLYRVRDLSNMTKKFKVEANCKQLTMTGAVIMFKDCNVIVVEGGPKQQAKYQRLMLNRIKWEEEKVTTLDGKEEPNKCILVWEGMVGQRNFGEIKFKVCATEKLAREQLKKHGVEHYWDLAYSASVLETDDK